MFIALAVDTLEKKVYNDTQITCDPSYRLHSKTIKMKLPQQNFVVNDIEGFPKVHKNTQYFSV